MPRTLYVTRFYKTVPNHTGKIKLTPPLDSYTIVLTLSIIQILEAGFKRNLFWVVWQARMVVSGLVKDLAWQESVVHCWVVGHTVFSVNFAVYQQLRSQYCPVISCLDFNHGVPPF